MYEIKSWTSLPTDSNQVNDTTIALVIHLANNDAKPVDITGYDPAYL